MRYISKAFRHCKSIQIVLPKKMCKDFGWIVNTHFIIEPHGDKQAIITSFDDWAAQQQNKDVTQYDVQESIPENKGGD